MAEPLVKGLMETYDMIWIYFNESNDLLFKALIECPGHSLTFPLLLTLLIAQHNMIAIETLL
jgi:hypothetical protein